MENNSALKYKLSIKTCTYCPNNETICQYCNGKKMWIEKDDSIKYFVNWPTSIIPEKVEKQITPKTINNAIIGLSSLISLVFLGLLFSHHYYIFNQEEILSIITQESILVENIYKICFGLFGLTALISYIKGHPSKSQLNNIEDIFLEKGNGQEEKWVCLDQIINQDFFSIINKASIIAQKKHYKEISPQIFLLALMSSNSIMSILSRMEINPSNIIAILSNQIIEGNQGYNRHILLSQTIEVLLYKTIIYSLENNLLDIQPWSVLPIYISEDWPLKETLDYFQINSEKIEKIISWYSINEKEVDLWKSIKISGATKPKGDTNKAWTSLPTPTLNRFSKDLTVLASYGVGNFSSIRQKEISVSIQVLSRKEKRSIILVGDAGSGKNTIIETISGLMVQEKVPKEMSDKRLVKLNIVDLINTTQENKTIFFTALEEIYEAGNVILYIPNIENMVIGENNSQNISSILNSALQENKLQVISTSTIAQYHKYIENNSALENAFEIIFLENITKDDCLTILEEEAPIIENNQKVFFSLPSLKKAIDLAVQFLPEQALPGSALSLLDQASSRSKTTNKQWVYSADVIKTLEEKTQIKIEVANSEEADLLLNFEKLLKSRIIGQEQAINTVSAALRRSRTGISNQNRPISSFLFVGPTGVGKTELSKAITELFYGKKEKMITLDMSEYQEDSSINKIIGSPNNTAIAEGSNLTKYVKENPYSLILLDEIEKSHQNVQNLFLQLLDEGRLTDNTGSVVNFRNTIIIATSNAGSVEIYNLIKNGTPKDELNKKVISLLNQYFKPEFLNRFDAIIPFHPLTDEQIKQIVIILLENLKGITREKNYEISFTEDAVDYLAKTGFDPLYGARPLRRIIQDKVETLLANLILENKLKTGSQLQIDAEMLKYL